MATQNNIFLQGNFAPWRTEDSIDQLEVIGKLPSDLGGSLLRNGPNPQFDPTGPYHWFNGDGMIHQIKIQNGQASYRNRWVHTERFKLERQAGRSLYDSSDIPEAYKEKIKQTPYFTANTNIVSYNNKLQALNEGSLPYAMELEQLNTLGMDTYAGEIQQTLSAHPRYDYQNKHLYTYSYISQDYKLRYYCINQTNNVIAQKTIDWPHPVMLHDFVNTENYIIFPLFPCTYSFERKQAGESFFMWEGDQLPTTLLITDKNGNEISRIETDPCYVYHFGNAYESRKNIIIDVMYSPRTSLMPDRNGNILEGSEDIAVYSRWVINLNSGTVKMTKLDNMPAEFPRFDERFNGRSYQYLYTAGGIPSDTSLFDRIIRYEAGTNNKQEFIFTDGDTPWEPVFVPRSAQEGDGYLLSPVYRAQENRSDIVIFNAQHVSDGPMATIKIPHRIPYGFHGNFVSG
jgi:carotenoid cleavage dioxygenase